MLDRWTLRCAKTPLQYLAEILHRFGCTADGVTIISFLIGLAALPALFMNWYWAALGCIIINRIGDGLDGTLARMGTPTDAGGFLDIVLDFVFYSSVVLGFALSDPASNGLAASVLLFTFVGTGSSFLAFAIMAEKRGVENLVYPQKGIYYLGGLAEGTETFLFFILSCLFPIHFSMFAYCFAIICIVTMVMRILGGYFILREGRID